MPEQGWEHSRGGRRQGRSLVMRRNGLRSPSTFVELSWRDLARKEQFCPFKSHIVPQFGVMSACSPAVKIMMRSGQAAFLLCPEEWVLGCVQQHSREGRHVFSF